MYIYLAKERKPTGNETVGADGQTVLTTTLF